MSTRAENFSRISLALAGEKRGDALVALMDVVMATVVSASSTAEKARETVETLNSDLLHALPLFWEFFNEQIAQTEHKPGHA